MIEERRRRGRDGKAYTVFRVRYYDAAGVERSKTLSRGATRAQAERLEAALKQRVWVNRQLAERRRNGHNGQPPVTLVYQLLARRARIPAEVLAEHDPQPIALQARALERSGEHTRAASAWVDAAAVALARAELARRT